MIEAGHGRLGDQRGFLVLLDQARGRGHVRTETRARTYARSPVRATRVSNFPTPAWPRHRTAHPEGGNGFLTVDATADQTGEGLLFALPVVSDLRRSRDVRHQLITVLAAAVGAVLRRGLLIRRSSEWAHDVPLSIRPRPDIGRRAPSASMMRRVLRTIPVLDQTRGRGHGWTETHTLDLCASTGPGDTGNWLMRTRLAARIVRRRRPSGVTKRWSPRPSAPSQFSGMPTSPPPAG